MKQLYIEGLKAGIAGGLAVAAILVLQVTIDLLLLKYRYSQGDILQGLPKPYVFSILLSLSFYIISGVLLLLTGVLSVWLARELVQDYADPLLVSAFSGIVASLVLIFAKALTTVISTLIIDRMYSHVAMLPGHTQLLITGASVFSDICLCGPVYLLVATVIALIGGCIFSLVVVK